jgi:glycosyltransferase involved in cell wall biosynthesis
MNESVIEANLPAKRAATHQPGLPPAQPAGRIAAQPTSRVAAPHFAGVERSPPEPLFNQTLLNTAWIVVPAYNEARRIALTIRALRGHYPNIVVVDDGSRDETSCLALAEDAWVLRHPINLGQGAALQTGIEFACQRGAAAIVTFDADGQHCVEEISRLLEPIRAGEADVVLGSRFLGRADGIPLVRRLMLKAGVLFTRFFSRIRVTDTHNGLRAFSRSAAERIQIRENRMAHASEILHQIRLLKLRYVERPVTIRYTAETLTKGQSTWNAFAILGQFIMGRLVP